MCGLVGYVGQKQALELVVGGLRRLEYRGYDSAGVAVICDGLLEVRKKAGKLANLESLLGTDPLPDSTTGIGHTRWATHGPPTDENSHPHLDESGKIAVVHNGVIENFDTLKERFQKAGHTFKSATDTEVLAHLIGHHYAELAAAGKATWTGEDTHPLAQAVMNALREVIGTYGIGVICTDHPGIMVGARRGSPLIVGDAAAVQRYREAHG